MDPQYFFHLNDHAGQGALEFTPKANRNISADDEFHNLFLSPSPYKGFRVRTSPGSFPPGFHQDPILCQALGGVVRHSEEDDENVEVEVYEAGEQHKLVTPSVNSHQNSSIEQVFTQLQKQEVVPLTMQQQEVNNELQKSAFFQMAFPNQKQSMGQLQRNDSANSVSPKQLSKVPKRKRTTRNQSNKKKVLSTILPVGYMSGDQTQMMNFMEQDSINITHEEQNGLPLTNSLETLPGPLENNHDEAIMTRDNTKIISSGQGFSMATSRLLYPFPTQSRRPSRNPQCCNCRKSGCMKLYCVCFGNGMYCSDACNCTDCKNNFANCVAIKAAWEYIIEQNPSGSLHCKCRRSRCRKSYCKCYEAGHKCGPWCGCVNCNNTEEGLKLEDQRQKSLKQSNSDPNDTSEETKSHMQYFIPGSKLNGGSLLLPMDSQYTSNFSPMMIGSNNTPLALAPPPFNGQSLPPLSAASGQTGPIVVLPHVVTDQGLPTGNLTLGYLQKTGPNVFQFFSTTPDYATKQQEGGNQVQNNSTPFGSMLAGASTAQTLNNKNSNNNSMAPIPLTPTNGNSEQTAMQNSQVENQMLQKSPPWLPYQIGLSKLIGGTKQVFVTDEISYTNLPPVFLNSQEQSEHGVDDASSVEEDGECEQLNNEEPFFTPKGSRPALPLLTPLGLEGGVLQMYNAMNKQNNASDDQASPNEQICSDGTTQSFEEGSSPCSYAGSLIKIGQPITASNIVRGFPVNYFNDKYQLMNDQQINQFDSLNNNEFATILDLAPTSQNRDIHYNISNTLDENEEYNQFIANFRTQHLSGADINLEDIIDVHQNEDIQHVQRAQDVEMVEGARNYKGALDCVENQQFFNDIPQLMEFGMVHHKKALQISCAQNSPTQKKIKQTTNREFVVRMLQQ